MRTDMLGVITILTLALVALPTLAQVSNPTLLKASLVNLYEVIAALENYFADFGQYPQSAAYLKGFEGRQYIADLPMDPCTGMIFGAHPGYTYSPVGNPAATFKLRTNWIAGGYGAECWAANKNANFQYSPGRGLQLTP